MKKTNYYTETYTIGDSYMVDIVNNEETYEAWFYHKSYGIKSLMFGLSIDDITHEMFVKVVTANIRSYIKLYKEEVEG